MSRLMSGRGGVVQVDGQTMRIETWKVRNTMATFSQDTYLSSDDTLQLLKWLMTERVQQFLGIPPLSARQHLLFATACCRRFWDLLAPQTKDHEPHARNGLLALEKLAEANELDASIINATSSALHWGSQASHWFSDRSGTRMSREAEGQLFGNSLSFQAKWNATDAVGHLCSLLIVHDQDLPHIGSCLRCLWRTEHCSAGKELPISTHPSHGTHPSFSAHLLRDIVGNPFHPVTLPKGKKRVPVGPFVIDAGTITHGFEDTECPWFTADVISLAQAAYDSANDQAEMDELRLLVLADALEEAGCQNSAIMEHLRSKAHTPHVRGCWAVDMFLDR